MRSVTVIVMIIVGVDTVMVLRHLTFLTVVVNDTSGDAVGDVSRRSPRMSPHIQGGHSFFGTFSPDSKPH